MNAPYEIKCAIMAHEEAHIANGDWTRPKGTFHSLKRSWFGEPDYEKAADEYAVKRGGVVNYLYFLSYMKPYGIANIDERVRHILNVASKEVNNGDNR